MPKEEPIGRPCECVYPFEKHLFREGLDALIRQQDGFIANIEKSRKQIEETGLADPDDMIAFHKTFRGEVEVVKRRLDAMPDCKATVRHPKNSSSRG